MHKTIEKWCINRFNLTISLTKNIKYLIFTVIYTLDLFENQQARTVYEQ